MIDAFDAESDNPELIWNGDARNELLNVMYTTLNYVSRIPRYPMDEVSPLLHVSYSLFSHELTIGGVYVSRFLKDPAFALRDASSFLEDLLHRWDNEIASVFSGWNGDDASLERDLVGIDEASPNLELVTSSIVFLCQAHGHLTRKVAEWGFARRCLKHMEVSLDRGLRFCPLLDILRVVNVSGRQKVVVEELSKAGGKNEASVVELFMRAVGRDDLHRQCAFILETFRLLLSTALGNLSFGLDRQSMTVLTPSPAPGEGPVRKRVDLGDDPLAMLAPLQSPSATVDEVTRQQQLQQPHLTLASGAHHKVPPRMPGTVRFDVSATPPFGNAFPGTPETNYHGRHGGDGGGDMGSIQGFEPRSSHVVLGERPFDPSVVEPKFPHVPSSNPATGGNRQTPVPPIPTKTTHLSLYTDRTPVSTSGRERIDERLVRPQAPMPAAAPPPPPSAEAPRLMGSGPAPTMHGTGVDARSDPTPGQVAKEQAQSTGGASGSIPSRATLLQQALACRLVQFLLNDVLENPSLSEVSDPAAAKAQAVVILQMLTRDPGYGQTFQLLLEDEDAWSKYKSQDFSLLMTGSKVGDSFLLTASGKERKYIKDGSVPDPGVKVEKK